jgi:hypothetical protein
MRYNAAPSTSGSGVPSMPRGFEGGSYARECGLSPGYFHALSAGQRAQHLTSGSFEKESNGVGHCCSETGSDWRALLSCAALSTKATSAGFLRSSKATAPEGGGSGTVNAADDVRLHYLGTASVF